MAEDSDFQLVFERLKAILQKFESKLLITLNEPGYYSLNTPYSAKYKKELFFGAVQVRKNYVSYHLMPVYVFPGLLDSISPRLRKRMQGKSCFNFKSVNEEIFTELEQLTQKGYEMFKTVSSES
jgi:hypothetical protein